VTSAARRSGAACLGCSAAFGALLVAVLESHALRRIDVWILFRVQATGAASHFELADQVTHLADALRCALAIVVLAIVAFMRREPLRAFAAAVILIGANGMCQLLQPQITQYRVINGAGREQQFPSGHATASLSLAAAAIILLWPRWRLVTPPALAYVLAIAAALIVTGTHLPSSVLGGWLLAGAWTFGVLTLRSSARPSRGCTSPVPRTAVSSAESRGLDG
jgi:membrane-associated phospholipid phosphatase